MKRGALQKKHSQPILVWFPNEIIPKIDRMVRDEDLDRSKFIRRAVREKLDRELPAQKATA